MRTLLRNGTRPIVFLMIDSTDHITGKTGLTPTVTLSKDGAAFASPAGSVAEIASGWYKLTPTSADSGTLGSLVLHASAAGADVFDIVYQVVAYDPEAVAGLGLTNLDATVSSRLATAGYTAPLDATALRAAIGIATANLDTQLTGLLARLPALVGGRIDASVGAMAANVITAAATAADYIAELQAALPSSTALDAAGTRAALGLATANLDTQFGSIPTANANATALLDGTAGVETGLTVRQWLRLAASALFGKASGLSTTTAVFRDYGDTKPRITATVDASGNRTAVTRDAT